MDYKGAFLRVLEENINEYDTIPPIKANILVEKFLKVRYDRELKHYSDEVRANDKFITLKNLEYLNLYVEELYLLDKDLTDLNYSIRKEMRMILHLLWNIVNDKGR